MPKLKVILEATVTAAEAEVLTQRGLKLSHDSGGLYVYTAGHTRHIYPEVTEAYIDHDEPVKLGGRFKAKR